MMLTKRWSRIAAACAAGALALGVGTVAAQSQGDPWWWDAFSIGPISFQSDDGAVTIETDTVLGDVMSGSLGRAREAFPETGEYIGCSITSVDGDGQFMTCAARDAAGNTLTCTNVWGAGVFAIRQQTMMNAAVNLTDSHYLAVTVDTSGTCSSIQVVASSADFLANRELPSDCTETNSVDLGPFGGSPVSVPNNACVKVTRFAKPFWPYGPNRTMQLQNPSGTAYPVPYSYEQACTGANGSGQFDSNFDDQYLPGLSDACPLFIKLKADGNGIISLRYW